MNAMKTQFLARVSCVLAVALCLVACAGTPPAPIAALPTTVPSPVPTSVVAAMPSAIPTAMAAPTPIATPTVTPAPTATAKSTPTPTSTSAPTATPTPTSTPTSTATATSAPTYALSGLIFFDYNGNGVQDGGEPPIPGASIRVGSLGTTSAQDGTYAIRGIPAGKRQVRVSAAGFRYLSLSPAAFQPIDQAVSITIKGNTQRDLGLMQGFLTLPFRCGTSINFIIYVDVDPGMSFRDWRGSDGSDYVKERSFLNGHLGTDFAVAENLPVLAAAPGKVIEAGLTDEGVRVTIDHGDGLLTIYVHLNDWKVKSGQIVRRGDLIGLSGRTGEFAPNQPAHVHFQFGGFGTKRIDPYRDVLSPGSRGYWTKDNDPQCPGVGGD